VLVPLVVLALFMGLASPLFTRRIEPAADALVRRVRAQTQPAATASAPEARTVAAGAAFSAEEVRRLAAAPVVGVRPRVAAQVGELR
jgi:hypothetical protein